MNPPAPFSNQVAGSFLSTATFTDLTDLIRREFVFNQKMPDLRAREIYIMDPIGMGQGNTKLYEEFDTETFARLKKQGAPAPRVQVGEGFTKIMISKRIAAEIGITYEMRTQNRYPQVASLITNLTHFCPQRIDLDQTHALTFANATTYTDMDGQVVDNTTGDGLAILNSAHLLAFSPATYTNIVPGNPQFSQSALEAAELLMSTQILSNFGQKRIKNFTHLIIADTPTVFNKTRQLVQSTADVTQANPNVKNMYIGKYQVLLLPYLATDASGAPDLTKKNWWFVGAIGQGTMGLQAYYGEWEAPHMNAEPENGNNGENTHTDTWFYGARAGYGLTFVSPKGIIGSTAS